MREISKYLCTNRRRAWRSHQVPRRVECMHTNVDQCAAAGTVFVGKPQTNSSGNSSRTDPSGSLAINFAETTFCDDVPSRSERWSGAQLALKKIDQLTRGRMV